MVEFSCVNEQTNTKTTKNTPSKNDQKEKRKGIPIPVFVLTTVLTISAAGFGFAQTVIAKEANEKCVTATQEASQLKQQAITDANQIKTLKQQIENTEQAKQNQKTQNNTSQKETDDLKKEKSELETKNEELTKQVETLTKERDEAKEAQKKAEEQSIKETPLDPTITAHHVEAGGYSWDYLLYRARPNATNQRLVLFLHGSGETAAGLETLKSCWSLPRCLSEEGYQPDCIILMPQDPVGGWSTEPTKALLDHVIEITHADKNRISVTGVSMGGFGTWAMLAAYPTFFESAAPIASDAYEDLSAVKSRVLALSGTADGYDGQSGVDAINNGTGGGHAEHKWVEGATHSDMCHIYADTTYNPMPFLMATDNASTVAA